MRLFSVPPEKSVEERARKYVDGFNAYLNTEPTIAHRREFNRICIPSQATVLECDVLIKIPILETITLFRGMLSFYRRQHWVGRPNELAAATKILENAISFPGAYASREAWADFMQKGVPSNDVLLECLNGSIDEFKKLEIKPNSELHVLLLALELKVKDFCSTPGALALLLMCAEMIPGGVEMVAVRQLV